MHGISPKNYSLTARQIRISTEISKVVPEFPTTLSDLISQMAVTDFSLATHRLEMGQDGGCLVNHKNAEIISAIELALTTLSTECGPLIKAQIFINASKEFRADSSTMPYLEHIMNGMKRRGLRIILDDVVFNNLNMNHVGLLDLSGMSAQRAVFRDVRMWRLKMEQVDFTDAKFIYTTLEYINISNSIITGATFFNVTLCGNEASGLTGNQSAIFKCGATYHDLLKINGGYFRIDRTHLNGKKVFASPDTAIFTFAVPNNIVPFAEIFHTKTHPAG